MATKIANDFSVEEKLASLITLQKIDSKLDEIKILKGELPMEVKDLEDEIEGLNTRLAHIDAEIKSMQDFIASKKNLQKEAEALIKKYESQQDNVKNKREFEAISKEIELQQLEVKLCEKHIKDATQELKEKTFAQGKAQETISNKQGDLDAKKGELDKIIAETEKEEGAYATRSNAAREKVEERLLTAYESIRKNYRNGLAVVPVLRDACGGCFNQIPPQRQAEIRQHKKILVCEHCGRILVDTELNDSITI